MKTNRLIVSVFALGFAFYGAFAVAQTSGYQNPLDRPAYNKSETREERALRRSGLSGSSSFADSAARFSQNQATQAQRESLQTEVWALRAKEEQLSKQSTTVARMSNEERRNYFQAQQTTSDLRIAKENEIKALQQKH